MAVPSLLVDAWWMELKLSNLEELTDVCVGLQRNRRSKKLGPRHERVHPWYTESA